ncbi:MAG: hypothetical protein IPI08_10955 [Betaproteobacteria bacterium]|nr:hypothetical protein [Betaproteobacteria bacterium]MBK8106470.1 hypothetical protein [Betaproteobacteria bacterium]
MYSTLSLFTDTAGAQVDAIAAMQAKGAVGSCTPELVYQFRPGDFDATGSGSAFATLIRYTDADGSPLPGTNARIDWTARAIGEQPGAHGARPIIGGNLDFVVVTGAGERLRFTATCIAGSGAYDLGFMRGITLYANGLTTGWPGGASVRRTFVHFESWTFGAESTTYVALLDGVDCRLNFNVILVTRAPYAIGSATYGGTPEGDFYSETSCANRFGNPFPGSGSRALLPD